MDLPEPEHILNRHMERWGVLLTWVRFCFATVAQKLPVLSCSLDFICSLSKMLLFISFSNYFLSFALKKLLFTSFSSFFFSFALKQLLFTSFSSFLMVFCRNGDDDPLKCLTFARCLQKTIKKLEKLVNNSCFNAKFKIQKKTGKTCK